MILPTDDNIKITSFESYQSKSASHVVHLSSRISTVVWSRIIHLIVINIMYNKTTMFTLALSNGVTSLFAGIVRHLTVERGSTPPGNYSQNVVHLVKYVSM